ncbi:hypothetical protein LMG28614_05619 [Paraburkholderia ultramafica]|uniref:Uncharacterized protein n=1 Tax=Paraburkholderia ultramafica TaxID=1544867 RepID=A0A6S7DDJ2_9BURK|nr:hypothetical protein [Paraburkholderia ultramafica]CAB3802484.1 hypothetical protein LMG28614_05619 [Paraburkholderia ultramafica]
MLPTLTAALYKAQSKIEEATRLRKIEEEGEPPELAGPELPRDTVINFWQERKPHLYDRSIQNESRYGAEVLFGTRLARDRFHFDKYSSNLSDQPDTREPFKLLPSAFLRRAEKMRPEDPQATASGFSQWLYSLYATAYGDEEDRERGKALEPAIFKHRLNAQGAVHNGYLRSIGSEWRLIHNGLHQPNQEHVDW